MCELLYHGHNSIHTNDSRPFGAFHIQLYTRANIYKYNETIQNKHKSTCSSNIQPKCEKNVKNQLKFCHLTQLNVCGIQVKIVQTRFKKMHILRIIYDETTK